ncbi:PQQ-binding-like beta-propeller repeat protein [Halorubrum sp. SD683]|uniref:outer membrane protein assembly factor BamB family protein n=1 Tax=Halorubrum sp. SD683 TaxID=1855873 RepID=UPI000A2D2632|nr:PQQ-binding-like beta-propeller repeat protein [Halorubrum sp. SD683]OTF01968.1 hypothetical protein B9G49_01610 [Halorubrum sp. SD683]
MRTATGVALLAVLVVLGGVGGIALTLDGGGGSLEEAWVSDTGRDVQSNHHAAAAGVVDGEGMVYAPISGRSDTPNCALYGLYGENGSADWQYGIPPQNCTIHSVANPALSDYDADGRQEVLVATTEQELVSLDAANGSVAFRAPLSSYGYSKPVVADLLGDDAKEIVAVDVRGTVFVFDDEGAELWSRELDTYTWGTPAVDDFDGDGAAEVGVGTGEGRVVMYDGNGSREWRTRSIGDSVNWMTTGPIGDGTGIAVGMTDGTVALVDAADGDVRWRKAFGDFGAVHAFADADDDGTAEVYATARDGDLRSVDAETGQVEWTTTLTGADVQMMPPPVLGDVDGDEAPELVAPTNDGRVSVVDPATGDVQATYERDVPIYTYPRLADTDGDGRAEIHVVYADGRVVMLEATGG